MLGVNVLWSLLKSPLGKAALALVTFLAWTAYQRQDAASAAVAGLKLELAEEASLVYEQQLQAVHDLAAQARDRAAESDQRASQMEAERDAIIEQLRAFPEGDCAIPDDVRERLLRIGR